jgi:hypothetical protein
MIKIVTLSLALSLVASAGFAGGVKDAKLQFVKTGPKVTLVNQMPPLLVLTLGGAAALIVGAVLGGSGNSTPASTTN